MTWQDVLKQAGFPADRVVVLDFETYFDKEYGFKQLSTVEYVMDPRFETLCLGYHNLANDTKSVVKGTEVRTLLNEWKTATDDQLTGYTIVGQNLKFDALVLREHYGITPKYTVDLLDLSRHLDARDRHSLEHLAIKYHAPTPKGETKQFSGLHGKDMTPEQHRALIEYCGNDVAITSYLFKLLLPRITWPEVELRLANQTLHQFLVPQIKLDVDLGNELITGIKSKLQEPVDVVNSYGLKVIVPPKITKRTCTPPIIRPVTVEDISKDGTFLALLADALPEGESIPMKQGKKRLIPALAKTDTQLDYLLSHPYPVVRALMDARKATDSWPGHISRVYKLLAQAQARGGFIGAPLKYYGAHTGRYSGCEGINFQNFGARDVDPLIKSIGGMLIAPPGWVFGYGDLSQIEARVVAWFAGQDDLLRDFAAGKDIYSEFAQTQIYHKETRKPRDDDPPAFVAELTTRRNVGKETILGAGFGMGGTTFYDRCCQKPSLKAAIASGELTRDIGNRAIQKYRTRYPMIPAFWKEVERAWRFVARYPDQQATVSHSGRTLRFWNERGTVIIQLPSGRCLFYPHARVEHNDQCRYQWGYMYGGAITENVVQACARDIFVLGLLRLQDAGLNPVFSIHDAAITLFPEETAKEQLEEMHLLQVVVPPWANGLPVAVDSKLLGKRFSK